MKKVLGISIIILTIVACVYFYNFNPEKKEKPFITCMLKETTGYDCPGCGGQRALHYLLHFDFIKALKLNFPIFIVGPLLLFFVIKYSLAPFGIELPEIYISNKTLLISFGILFLYMLIRNIPHYPFILLKS